MTDRRRKCVVQRHAEIRSDPRLLQTGGSVTYEGVLAAAVVATLTISALGMFVIGPATGTIPSAAAAESHVPRLERTSVTTVSDEPSRRSLPIDPRSGRVDFHDPKGQDHSASTRR